jgi:hypothetical protein
MRKSEKEAFCFRLWWGPKLDVLTVNGFVSIGHFALTKGNRIPWGRKGNLRGDYSSKHGKAKVHVCTGPFAIPPFEEPKSAAVCRRAATLIQSVLVAKPEQKHFFAFCWIPHFQRPVQYQKKLATSATFSRGFHYSRAARRVSNRKLETNCLRKSLQVNTVTCYQ